MNYPTTYNYNGTQLVPTAGPTYTYSYDSMDRPTGLKDQNSNTDVSNVTYNAANQLLGLTYFGTGESRTYNNLNQMTNVTVTGATSLNVTYTFPAGTNNGKISSQTDAISEETVTYQYDSLNRLLSASGSGWGDTYGYDGFGNLLSKTGTGTAPVLSQSVNAATNQIVGAAYDANGNQTTGIHGTAAYDAENRMVLANSVQYAYDSRNKRIWSGKVSNGNLIQTVYFYGVDGQLLGTYPIGNAGNQGQVMVDFGPTLTVFFARKRIGMISSTGVQTAFVQDRLGSAGKYYPYGEARGTVPEDAVGFATYTNDSATGLEYADQRYYASNFGRFMTVDPANAGGLLNPQSLNRYSYVLDDPINSQDPEGLCSVIIAGITESPGANSAELQLAQGANAITAFPYAGGGVPGGIASVIQQGLGIPNGATLTALEAIALAAQSPGDIDITTFSGGAAAFTAAWNYLTPEVQSRIRSISYIAPGSYQGLVTGNPNTDLRIFNDSSDLVNDLLNMFGGSATPPPGQNLLTVDTTPCGHSISCVLDNFGWRLQLSSCDIGARGVFGAPLGLARSLIQASTSYYIGPFGPPIIEYFWELPPIPVVWSTLKPYNPPQ